MNISLFKYIVSLFSTCNSEKMWTTALYFDVVSSGVTPDPANVYEPGTWVQVQWLHRPACRVLFTFVPNSHLAPRWCLSVCCCLCVFYRDNAQLETLGITYKQSWNTWDWFPVRPGSGFDWEMSAIPAVFQLLSGMWPCDGCGPVNWEHVDWFASLIYQFLELIFTV